MAFPSVASVTATAFATAGTLHAMNYPATVNLGDLLLMPFAVNDGATITTPSGYTQLDQQQGGTPAIGAGIFAKRADGSEGGGTENVTIGTSKTACGQILRITGWGGIIASDIDISTYATGTNNVPNPGSVTAGWGSDDNLYVAIVAAGDDDETVTGDPSGFTGLTSTVSGGGVNDGCTLGTSRNDNIAASLDPDTFTLSGSEEWLAWTLVIGPTGISGASGPLAYHHLHHNLR